MVKCKITKQEVYNAASSLIVEGQNPTHCLLKIKLGRGSYTTIHKYFKGWKEECFKNGITHLQIDKNKCDLFKTNKSHVYIEEKRNLEQILNKHISQNEHYAQELINTEKANIALKEEIHQLQFAMKKIQFELTEIKAAKNTLEQINKEIQNTLDINSNKTIKKMKQTIDNLRLELKALNETSIAALRETSNKGHETLMQEKVTSINLQAKIDSLNTEFLESKKQLHEAIMTAQVQNRSLLRQNEQLQKIIQERGLDKLPQLEEESVLKFAKEVAAYGK